MNNVKGLLKRRFVAALTYSLKGLKACYIHEEAFRLEVWLAIGLIPLGLWLGNDSVERALLVGSVGLVLIVELLNSAVEAAVDRISLEHAELSGRAKDLGSAAVLLSVIMLAVVWGLLLFS